MNNFLSGAYEDALKELSKTEGVQLAIIVRSVILAKHTVSDFENTLQPLEIEDDIKKALIDCVQDQVATNVASMCMLVNKRFKADVLPFVEQITEKATQPGPHLQ